MDTKVLEEIGLTKGEIKVYLTLLEEGSSSAGSVLKKANIQNSVFHFNINRLIEKGLVSYVLKDGKRIYSSTDPENILTYVKDKEKEIENILPELKIKQNLNEEKQEVELFEGIKGIMNLLNIFIKDAKEGDEFLLFSPEQNDSEEIQNFYKRYDAKRKEKGLVVKGIAPLKLKKVFESRKGMEMRYSDFSVPVNSGTCNDKFVMISWGEKPSGILITSKDIVKKQKKFFEAMWNKIK